MESITKKQAKKRIKKGTKKITEEDIRKVLVSENILEEKINNNSSFKKIIDEIKLFFSIIKDYTNGTYKEIPFWTIGAITFSLLYALSPIDFIPDFIPVIGYVDDALIIATCYKMVKKDLEKYKEWKAKIGLAENR